MQAKQLSWSFRVLVFIFVTASTSSGPDGSSAINVRTPHWQAPTGAPHTGFHVHALRVPQMRLEPSHCGLLPLPAPRRRIRGGGDCVERTEPFVLFQWPMRVALAAQQFWVSPAPPARTLSDSRTTAGSVTSQHGPLLVAIIETEPFGPAFGPEPVPARMGGGAPPEVSRRYAGCRFHREQTLQFRQTGRGQTHNI